MKNQYNNYFLIVVLFLFSLFIASCSSDNDRDRDREDNETSELIKIQEFTDDNYTFSLYSRTGELNIGYNEIYMQVKNKSTGEFEKNTSFSWHPIMHMVSKTHSCPYNSPERVANTQTLYKGFIIFQMATNAAEYWELSLNYSLNGQNFQISENLNVINSSKRRIQIFKGTDDNKYVLAMVKPSSPFVGINDMTVYLYKMQDMETFVPVEGYTIIIDPRMPGMGNHSSPNNADLVYVNSGLYKGKLSFTMTGYWKVNMIILDAANQILKGEPITEINEASSIFFELEF